MSAGLAHHRAPQWGPPSAISQESCKVSSDSHLNSFLRPEAKGPLPECYRDRPWLGGCPGPHHEGVVPGKGQERSHLPLVSCALSDRSGSLKRPLCPTRAQAAWAPWVSVPEGPGEVGPGSKLLASAYNVHLGAEPRPGLRARRPIPRPTPGAAERARGSGSLLGLRCGGGRVLKVSQGAQSRGSGTSAGAHGEARGSGSL